MSSTIQNQSQPATAVRRGDIFYADLSPVVGSEQGGLRPVLIIQNDVGNRYSPTVIAAAITSRMGKTKLPTHIDVYADRVGLSKDSVILLEQIRTLDKRRLREKMGHLDEDVMAEVNNAIAVSFGLHEGLRREEDTTTQAPHDHTDSTPREAPPRVHHNPRADPRPAKSPQRVERPSTDTPNVAAASVESGDRGDREARTNG